MSDTINGYPIIATFPTDAGGATLAGRVIIVDRGVTHEERYVVAWQGVAPVGYKPHWEGSSYHRSLADARAAFVRDVQREVL